MEHKTLINSLISKISQSPKTQQPPEIELIQCDTILGTSKYHLFDNRNTPLTVWLRNSEISAIHTFSLLSVTGEPVIINTKNSQFTLDSQTPFLRLIYTNDG